MKVGSNVADLGKNVVSYNCSGVTLRGMQKIIPIGEKYAKRNNKAE